MSRVGTLGDNPINESLNGWIKEELFMDFQLNECHGREEVLGCIERYIKYYNSKRPSWALNYDTPDNYYKRFMNGEIVRKKLLKIVYFRKSQKAGKSIVSPLLKMKLSFKHFFCPLFLTSTCGRVTRV